jgi:hypothetical protein
LAYTPRSWRNNQEETRQLQELADFRDSKNQDREQEDRFESVIDDFKEDGSGGFR